MTISAEQLREYARNPEKLRILNRASLEEALRTQIRVNIFDNAYSCMYRSGDYKTNQWYSAIQDETLFQFLARTGMLTVDFLTNFILPVLNSPSKLNDLIKDCENTVKEHIILTIAEHSPYLLVPLFEAIGIEPALALLQKNYQDGFSYKGNIMVNLQREYSSVLNCLARKHPAILIDVLKWFKSKDIHIDLSKELVLDNYQCPRRNPLTVIATNQDNKLTFPIAWDYPLALILVLTPETRKALLELVNEQQKLRIDDISILFNYFMGFNEAKTLGRERVSQEAAARKVSYYAIGALHGRIDQIRDSFFAECTNLFFDFLEESLTKKDKEHETNGAIELLVGLLNAAYELTEEKRIKVLVDVIQRREKRIQNTSRNLTHQPEKLTNLLYKNVEGKIKRGYPTLFSPKASEAETERFDSNNPWIKLHRYLNVISTCNPIHYSMLEPWFVSLHAKHYNQKNIDVTIVGADRPPKKNIMDQSWRNAERDNLIALTNACAASDHNAHNSYQKFLKEIKDEAALAEKMLKNYPENNEAGSSSGYTSLAFRS